MLHKHYSLADDKVKTKELLHKHHIACAETYTVITRVSEVKHKWNSCQKYNAVAIKPISEALIFQHITNIISGLYSMNSSDSCLIEECIIPHPFFAEIYDEGVPDFRVITLKEQPLMAMLRMPTSKSKGKANLHQKGVGIGIDMEQGILTQVYDGKKYSDHHPDNPEKINGKPIPYWDEIIALSKMTAKAFPLDYLGIDLVIDKTKGPQIMEVNVRPGLGIQLVNKCGLQNAIQHTS